MSDNWVTAAVGAGSTVIGVIAGVLGMKRIEPKKGNNNGRAEQADNEI
jgi:hypothetical protein